MFLPRTSDRTFVILAAALLLIGLIMLTSASGPTAIQKFGDPYQYVKHQFLFGILPGLVLFVIAANIEPRFWKHWSGWIFAGAVILLGLALVPGVGAANGAARSWLAIAGITVQPGELAKPAIILFLASRFEAMGADAAADHKQGLLLFAAVLAAVCALFMAQPDMGTMTVVVCAAAAVFFMAGASWVHLGLMAVAAGASFTLLIRSSQYRVDRLVTLLHPEQDPQGIGYHINQAFLAIGSGGLFGLGLGHSRQKFLFLPEVIHDSIFAVMAEETGLILSLAFLGLLLAFFWRGLAIARGASDRFGRMVVAGVMAWLFSQTIFNIGSMVGLIPITGLPLPFVSYGGTAMVTLLGTLGIVVSVSSRAEVKWDRGTRL